MSTVHFVGGEKGGVGKSVVARLLAQLFIDRALPFVALGIVAHVGRMHERKLRVSWSPLLTFTRRGH